MKIYIPIQVSRKETNKISYMQLDLMFVTIFSKKRYFACV